MNISIERKVDALMVVSPLRPLLAKAVTLCISSDSKWATLGETGIRIGHVAWEQSIIGGEQEKKSMWPWVATVKSSFKKYCVVDLLGHHWLGNAQIGVPVTFAKMDEL